MCGSTTNTTTTAPNPQAAANYADVTAQAKNVAATPYQPYNGELVAGLNQGQNDAVGELQSGYGVANPYLNSGSNYLDSASTGLGNVQNYLQTASGLGNIAGFQNGQQSALGNAGTAYGLTNQSAAQMSNLLPEENNYLGQAAGSFNQAQGYATPQQFSQAALQQYMSPYTQDVVNSTMANAQQQDAIQAQQLGSNAIGQGAYGGDRSGIAQASLAGQQALANNQTIAGLEDQGYSTALGQFNQNQANQFQAASTLGALGQGYNQTASGAGNVASGYGSQAGIYGNLGQGYTSLGNQYNTAGNQQLQQASLYNSLGQTAGQQAQAYGTLAGQAGNLGNIAQSTNTAGASAALQGSTLQQQNAQQQDAAAYQQFQNAIQYPFQTTSYLANIDEGVGSNQGSSTTSPGASVLSQVAGAGTAGLGILGAIGGSSGVSGGLSTIGNGLSSLFSDERVKQDVAPIGKTFDGQTMYRYRYKDDPSTFHTGLIAQEVERHTPQAVSSELGGIKAVEYKTATDEAAARGHFARGGNVGLGGLGEINRPQVGMSPTQAEARGLVHATGLIGRPPYDTRPIGGSAYARGGLVPGYADGGAADGGDDGSSGMGSVLFDPTAASSNGGLGLGGLGANAAWSSAGLGVTPTATQAVRPTGLAPRPASMPVLNAAPIAQPTAISTGLGALAASGGNGSAGFTDPNHDQNVWLGITAAGLGMMGGSSPQAGVNIGQGGLAGLQEFTTLQQQGRQNAVQQQELGLKQSDVNIRAAQLAQDAERYKNESAVQTGKLANETASTNAGLVTTSPGFDPNTGDPGFCVTDKRDPGNPVIRFQRVQVPGASAPGAAASGAAVPGVAAAPPLASPGAGPDTPAGGAPPASQAAAGATPPQGSASAAPASSTASTNPLAFAATTDVPRGYVPPNQMAISLNPTFAKTQNDAGMDAVKDMRGNAAKAQTAQIQLQQMNSAIDGLPKSGLLAPGSFADERLNFAKAGNTLAATMGLNPVFDEKQVGDGEQAKKDAFRLGTQMIANTNGGREAGFILNASVGATPGMNNSYLGFKRVAAGLQMANQYTIDRANFMDNYQAKFGHLNGAEQLFDQINPPQAYAAKAIALSTIPKQPSNIPQGSAYSMSRGLWRAPNGSVYDAQGAPLTVTPAPSSGAVASPGSVQQ